MKPSALTFLLVPLLTGCGIGTMSVAPVPASYSLSLQGQMHGGQQPVSGATVYLYAAGVGGSAVDLLAPNIVQTNQNGNFTITGYYTCPSSTTQVYLVGRGGNPGLTAGTNNAALTLMAALGDCGDLTSSTFVSVNEVTTAAAAWALSHFLTPGAIVSATSTNATGLRNAFLSAQNLVNGRTGLAPGSSLPQGAALEVSKLYTLADALAACVNSDGTSACTPLFSAATDGGATPTNTLDAALNIVANPAANVAAIFGLASAKSPFQPTLSSAPNDWTMSITYSGGGLNQPGDLAIDSTGSIWVANYFGAVVSKFSPTGVPAAAQGFPGTGLHQSFGVAIDPYDNAWVSNETSVTGANNSHLGSISKFNTSGTELSSYGYTGGGIYYPQGIASDASGNIWVSDYGRSSASLLANNGTAISGASGYAPSALPFTSAVAIDAAGNAWFAEQEAATRITPAGSFTTYSCCVDPAAIAIDKSGNIWLADYGGASVVELTPQGAVANRIQSANGTDAAQGIAIDGGGHIFAANFRGDSITELAAANATLLSPTTGFGLDAPLNEPLGISVDASGNLWLTNSGDNTLTEFLGLASPIQTPLLGPPSSP